MIFFNIYLFFFQVKKKIGENAIDDSLIEGGKGAGDNSRLISQYKLNKFLNTNDSK